MVQYKITKHEFERLLNYRLPSLWESLVPTKDSTKMGGISYDITLNPFYQLRAARGLYHEGYVTCCQYYSIKKKCITAYWRGWLNCMEWIEWHEKHLYNLDKTEAKSKFGALFVLEYISKQKKALAEGCSNLVFKDGSQIPDEIEEIIMEYIY